MIISVGLPLRMPMCFVFFRHRHFHVQLNKECLNRKEIFSSVIDYLTFKKFVENYGLKNEATSTVKIKDILDILSRRIHDSCKVYMRDDKLTTDSGIVNLHPSVGIHWVMFINKYYFDSYGCPPPINILNYLKIGQYSEYQIQQNDSFCAAYCLNVLYLTQVIGFKNAILNLYYQTYS